LEGTGVYVRVQYEYSVRARGLNRSVAGLAWGELDGRKDEDRTRTRTGQGRGQDEDKVEVRERGRTVRVGEE
jgi:hypothetical protein